MMSAEIAHARTLLVEFARLKKAFRRGFKCFLFRASGPHVYTDD